MTPVFTAFNKNAPVDIYYRNLPHWLQRGATYFVTFRLADSIPRALLEQWIHERTQWLKARGITDQMERRERENEYGKVDLKQRRNFERQNHRRLLIELDQCHGCCLFKNAEARHILQAALLHYDRKYYYSGDFVIMPNHVHWIIQPLGEYKLWKSMQSIKRFVSTQLRPLKPHEGRLWQNETYDHLIRNYTELTRIRKYIADNPMKANLSTGAYSHITTPWLDA